MVFWFHLSRFTLFLLVYVPLATPQSFEDRLLAETLLFVWRFLRTVACCGGRGSRDLAQKAARSESSAATQPPLRDRHQNNLRDAFRGLIWHFSRCRRVSWRRGDRVAHFTATRTVKSTTWLWLKPQHGTPPASSSLTFTLTVSVS